MRARLNAGRLNLPTEAHDALGSPTWLALTSMDDGSVRITPAGVRERLLRRRSCAQLTDRNGDAVFQTTLGLPAGEFGLSNYERAIYLLPIADSEEATDREGFWKRIPRYAEHLPPEEQDNVANKVSEWLAREVLLPLGRSFLEVGCGAGRNLSWLHLLSPQASLSGLDVNEEAIAEAQRRLPEARLKTASLYRLAELPEDHVDVAFTSGVLMHVPESALAGVILEMHRVARSAVVHFELHGPTHGFDFHRYPRDYSDVYTRLGLPLEYTVFPRDDVRSLGTDSFQHSLLVSHH